MDIPVKISQSMDKAERNDSRLMRAPKDFRDLFGLEVGDFVTIRGNDGRLFSLLLDKAYEADSKSDPLCAYVTSSTFPLIAKGTTQSCDVDTVKGITLGCDPELMIIDRTSGDLVSAQYFFGLKKWGPVGFDGLLLELRPLPSIDEEVVAGNLANLILQARKHLNTCKMYPNTMMAGISSFAGRAAVAKNIQANTALYQPNIRLSAGFHLHFGLPKEILGWQKKFVAQQVIKALDYYVGIPAIIPEGHGDSYRRTVQGIEYGKPGMFRLDHRTLEYRTPGAALMKHPILAQGLIGLGALVMEDVVSRVRVITEDFKNLKEISNDSDIRALYPNIPPVMEIFRAICAPNTDVAKSHIATIKNDLKDMVGYERHANSINNFFNNMETPFSIDVEENWWRYKNHGER